MMKLKAEYSYTVQLFIKLSSDLVNQSFVIIIPSIVEYI